MKPIVVLDAHYAHLLPDMPPAVIDSGTVWADSSVRRAVTTTSSSVADCWAKAWEVWTSASTEAAPSMTCFIPTFELP